MVEFAGSHGPLSIMGQADCVKAAITVSGMFQLTGNHVSGFDEKDASALSLASDSLGRTARSTYRDNLFQRCTSVVPQPQKALWDAAKPEGNIVQP